MLILATDITREIQSPHVILWVERKRLERNLDFSDPAPVVASRLSVPDAAPGPVFVRDTLIDSLVPDAVHCQIEGVPCPSVIEWIEHDREAVLAERPVALTQNLRTDLVRFLVEESCADIKGFLRVDDQYLRVF